jgi:hypothetical protein
VKIIKISLILSIIINIGLLLYLHDKNNRMKDTLSRLTVGIQSDLVQLENSIDYEIKNNWIDDNRVLEKIEDVRESINSVWVTAKYSGVITTELEQDLLNLSNFLSRYPEYTGFPTTDLSNDQKRDIKELRNKLRRAGWGMNLSYHFGNLVSF